MTQLMLFDTDSLTTTAAPLATPIVPTTKASAKRRAGSSLAASRRSPAQATRIRQTENAQVAENSQVIAETKPMISPSQTQNTQSSSGQPGDENMHRMGDLARLVLLRYQLVAKRREELLARSARRAAARGDNCTLAQAL
ncbi:hypothetical protein LOC67_22270 [Stieleria sp. JC731]|uniref:hypothetical protein n=1 Tax=Pirellulaceae TaxID=2691357 RepID=UPI001E64D3B8|nr:hypothetical protein [Stieleria sp. JC731]MCC9603284.1 hypothetical protein [Stieleria sp. JC731]